eukprot:8525542-Pyramimonas_sp.AAC.1
MSAAHDKKRAGMLSAALDAVYNDADGLNMVTDDDATVLKTACSEVVGVDLPRMLSKKVHVVFAQMFSALAEHAIRSTDVHPMQDSIIMAMV